ncbi:hypothetical protein [Saccharothrix syringae]|uniref:Integrase catalytic domain-containing protein n=1 Tax=Saccharothrix syringae TaxID=103733 RepID=A0A5Q0GX63_SACSY|nr:hypothetical protein [Saccharothrix syringae]QFZ18559.1 hypothetical protein EKG83_14800 [Saccharothrix syringae]
MARDFLADAVARNGAAPHTVHADRGGAMVSDPVSGLLVDLGVLRSHSSPCVFNDNPSPEAPSKTMKHMPDFPDRFDSPVTFFVVPDQGAVVAGSGMTCAPSRRHDPGGGVTGPGGIAGPLIGTRPPAGQVSS